VRCNAHVALHHERRFPLLKTRENAHAPSYLGHCQACRNRKLTWAAHAGKLENKSCVSGDEMGYGGFS
jgi:hypothetical protein